MKRTLIGETPGKVGEKVRIKGWISTKRDHGKITFIDLKDRSGVVQLVVLGTNKKAFKGAKEARIEAAIEACGVVKKRPENLINQEIPTGEIEIEVESLEILSNLKEDLPIDISSKELNLTLENLLKFRNLVLRNEKVKAIFFVFQEVLSSYAQALKKNDFVEIKTPKIISSASESGANVFKIKYFDQMLFWPRAPNSTSKWEWGSLREFLKLGRSFGPNRTLLLAISMNTFLLMPKWALLILLKK